MAPDMLVASAVHPLTRKGIGCDNIYDFDILWPGTSYDGAVLAVSWRNFRGLSARKGKI